MIIIAISHSAYIKCPECNHTQFQEILVTKLLIGAAEAVKQAPLDTPVTPMFKEDSEVMYKCLMCGRLMDKEILASQSGVN